MAEHTNKFDWNCCPVKLAVPRLRRASLPPPHGTGQAPGGLRLPAGKQGHILTYFQTKVYNKMTKNALFFVILPAPHELGSRRKLVRGAAAKGLRPAPACLSIQRCIAQPATMFTGFSLCLTHLRAYQGP
jgi:hypothetical protein